MRSDDEILNDLRMLGLEIERAYHSWSIFLSSVREFESENQNKLIEALNAAEIGGTVNHLQMVLLHDCVGSICRITDEHKPDRITLHSLMTSMRNRLRGKDLQRCRDLDEKRKNIIKSAELAELKTFRNSQIGHILRNEAPPTKYKSIPVLIDLVSDLLNDIFSEFGYSDYIGKSFNAKKIKRAVEFWNCVERGAS